MDLGVRAWMDETNRKILLQRQRTQIAAGTKFTAILRDATRLWELKTVGQDASTDDLVDFLGEYLDELLK